MIGQTGLGWSRSLPHNKCYRRPRYKGQERKCRAQDGAGYLKKSSRVLCEGVAARYATMKKLRLNYPLPQLCRVLKVSASGYYAWMDRPLSKWARQEARLEVEIKAAHRRTRQVYGAEKLQYGMAEYSIKAGICRIKRIRRKLGISCKQKRKFKATTDSRHKLPVAENILGQQFTATAPNKVWVSDITYVPTDEGWLYVASHKDLFNGRYRRLRNGRKIDQKPGQPILIPGNRSQTSVSRASESF